MTLKAEHALAAVAVAALWGGNFVSSKIGLAAFPAFLFTGLRFFVVAAVLLPFLRPLPANQLWRLFCISMTLCVGHIGLIVLSMGMGLNVAATVVIAQMGVPFSCLLGTFLLGDRLGKWRLSGLFIAFFGISIIAGTPNAVQYPAAFVVAMIGALLWAVSNIQLKKLGEVPILQLLAWKSLFAVPVLFFISWIWEGPVAHPFSAVPFTTWIALAYTALGSTVAAYSLWSFLMRRYAVSQVAPFSLLTPVFGIAAAELFFAEVLSAELLIGALVTVVGVGIITLRRPKILQFGEERA